MTVVNSHGHNSGWFDARFHDSVDTESPTSKEALDDLWSFRTPGIPFSRQGVRFDPLNRTKQEDQEGSEIALWAEPIADFWKTLSYSGPWQEDLTHRDRAVAKWGKEAWRFRHRAAGCIQVLIDRLTLDRRRALCDDDGILLVPFPSQEKAQRLVSEHPQFARWLAAVGGPRPNAEAAHEAMVSILNEPRAAFAMVANLFGVLSETDDEDLQAALHATFEAALRDCRTTRGGRHRPWLANTEGPVLTLSTCIFRLCVNRVSRST